MRLNIHEAEIPDSAVEPTNQHGPHPVRFISYTIQLLFKLLEKYLNESWLSQLAVLLVGHLVLITLGKQPSITVEPR